MYPAQCELIVICSSQIILLILFFIFAKYDKSFKEKSYDMFQDIHVMMFIGFGFLMTFLRRYGFGAVGFNFLLGAIIIQWSIICQGFFHLDEHFKISVGIVSLYQADIAAATVLISMGAVLGVITYIQLIIMGLCEIVFYLANYFICATLLQVLDAGGSIFVHSFGAYYGLAVSFVVGRNQKHLLNENPLQSSRYTSDLFAMIGTIFLWLYWPSFNAIDLENEEKHRAIINTYLSLAASCVTTFAMSLMFSNNSKFNMAHIQNATLAGGVAVGASANFSLQPYGAILIGIISGILSVYGFNQITPFLFQKLNIHDTCGVNNLHGMPGILGGIISAIMVYIETQNNIASNKRNPIENVGFQLCGIIITLVIAIVFGLATGALMNMFPSPPNGDIFDDSHFWTIEGDAGQKVKVKHKSTLALIKPSRTNIY